jgi:hypothetical protein
MPGRRWPWIVLPLAVAALAGVGALMPADPLDAARRRVPLGADEDAVAEAVGRTA